MEIELDQDPPYPHLAGPAVAAAAPGDRGLPPARTAAPQSAAQDEERAPARAARSTTPPLRKPAPSALHAGDIGLDQNPPYPHLAGPAVAAAAPGDRGLPPARTAPPQSAAQDEERAPARAARSTTPPLRKPAPAGESHRQAAASGEGDFRPTPVQAADRETRRRTMERHPALRAPAAARAAGSSARSQRPRQPRREARCGADTARNGAAGAPATCATLRGRDEPFG